MTDSVLLPGQDRHAVPMFDDKTAAFRLASRHSSRVRLLRTLMLVASLALCGGIVVFAFFNPFRGRVPDTLSIESAGLSGSRVTMARPKMAGFRQDGRPYDFIARSAVQDVKVPNVLELNELDAHVTMADKTVAHVVADTSVYNASTEIMDLKGNVHITSDSGYDIRMSMAHIEFKGGNMASREPVSVVMKTGTVSADTLRMSGNGSEITFEGRVHSVMQPATAASDAAVPAIKGTAP